MTKSEIKEIILDEFKHNEMKNYRETYDNSKNPFYVGTFVWCNPIVKDIVKDKGSLAECLAACWMNMNMDEIEIRKATDNIFEYYDDSDIFPEIYDENGY